MSVENYDPKFIADNPWQTRQREPDPEYIKDLAEDIKKNGLLQVPMGRVVSDEKGPHVQLAFGHNRLRAYLLLELAAMPVDVRQLTDEQMASFAWSENERRRDVTAIERAMAIEKRIKDFGWTNRQVAEALEVDHSTISNLLRLLKLPEELQQANIEGKLSERQIQAILPLFDLPEEIQKKINNYYYSSPNQIVEYALAGNSSDYLRERVEQLFRTNSMPLEKTEFKLDQQFTEGEEIYCGLCKTCDKRMPSRNLCFDKICFEAKTRRTHQDYLNNASFVLGYPVDDPDKAGWPTELMYYGGKRETIIASKCPSLVLVYRHGSQEFDAFPDVHLVCSKRNQSCSCLKGLDVIKEHPEAIAREPVTASTEADGDETPAGESEPITSDELQEAARVARREKIAVNKERDAITAKLAKRIEEDLNRLEPGAFYAVVEGLYVYHSSNLNLSSVFKKMSEQVARKMMPWGMEWDSIEKLLKGINHHMANLKLEPFSLEEKPEKTGEMGVIIPETKDSEEPVDYPIFEVQCS